MATAAPGRASLFTPAFVALTIADLLYFSATGVLLAATPLFVRDEIGADETGVGLAMGAFSVTTLALRPFAGRWTDRHGRRGLLVAGAGAFAVVTLGHLLLDNLATLVLLRLVLGAAEALYFVAGFAALADLAPPGRVGEALSLNSLALYVGIAVGPLLGQLALRLGGFAAAWVTASALAGLATIATLRVPETAGAHLGRPSALVYRPALGPGLILFVGVGASAGFLAFAVLHARAVGLVAWGIVPCLFGLTVVVLRVALATVSDRSDPLALAGLALVVDALALFVIGASSNVAGLLAGAIALGVGTSLVTPAVFAAVFAISPAGERGAASATTSIFIDLGLSGGPVAVGAVAAAVGLTGSFQLWSLLPLVAGVTVLGMRALSARRVPSGSA